MAWRVMANRGRVSRAVTYSYMLLVPAQGIVVGHTFGDWPGALARLLVATLFFAGMFY